MSAMQRSIWLIWILAAALGLAPGSALAVVLYDGSLGSLPGSQGWLYLTDPLFGAGAVQSFNAGAAVLNTTPSMSDSAGYFSTLHPAMPRLDRNEGVRVRFDLKLDEETHASSDRAGLSLIALSSDKSGIELGFWEDQVWAQSGPAFTHAEQAGLNTTSLLRSYELNLVGNDYSLLADGEPLLSGPLRDYSSHPHPVYSSTNFLFLGDDTGSASAQFRLASVEVITGTALPEPGTLALAALGVALAGLIFGPVRSR
jgi:hypothetical protein